MVKIGSMNNPYEDVYKEITRIGKQRFDFVDLTLEPPKALGRGIGVKKVKALLARYGLGLVGHTAWHLPLNSPYDNIRKAALEQFEKDLETFARLGSPTMNVHLQDVSPKYSVREAASWHIAPLRKLVSRGRKLGIAIMLEHTNANQRQLNVLGRIMKNVPGLKFHLDIGHANLESSRIRTAWLLKKFGKRLAHVHASDNFGGTLDMHLPIGLGNIDWKSNIRQLKKHGYDGTVTLEVFRGPKIGLAVSHKLFRKIWQDS